ncbi:MAG: disulfide bond formation protein DsbA [Actinomycetia bacterium]|nr:disulfide bond formation protein DsbA [Actinomycetes bacterium]MCP4087836.1 disulfide bond formation protein DsbA [Actinomycetes bacterium]
MTTIDVYADIVCPFAYIGLTRILQRRQEMGRDDVHLRIRSWPLEWVNGKPVDPHFIGEEVDEIRPQVGADLFTGFDVEAFPASSVPGLALTAVAYEVSDQVGEEVAMGLRSLLFEEGRDVMDPAVLAEVAARHGLEVSDDPEPVVRAEFEGGQGRGVVGSPHFFVGEVSTFCPSLDIQRVDGHLEVKMDEAAFEALIGTIFA